MKLGRGLVALLVALGLILALAQPAFAGLKVVGAKIEAQVSPGSETTYNIQVVDNTDSPMNIAIAVKGFGLSAEGTLQVLEPDEDISPYSAREFLTVSPDSFHLEPGESQDVTVTARIPADVGDGGRYAIVFIHTVPAPGGSFAVVTAIAVPVLFTIKGSTLTRDSDVTEVRLGEIATGEPLEATVTIFNKGNHHYKPQVEAKIRAQGKVVATCPAVVSSRSVLPGYSQQLKLDIVANEPLPAGTYEVEIKVKDDAGKLVTNHTCALDLGQVWQPPLEEPSPQEPGPQAQDTSAPTAQSKPAQEPTPAAQDTSAPAAQPKATNWHLMAAIVAVAAVVGLLVYIYFPVLERRLRARRK